MFHVIGGRPPFANALCLGLWSRPHHPGPEVNGLPPAMCCCKAQTIELKPQQLQKRGNSLPDRRRAKNKKRCILVLGIRHGNNNELNSCIFLRGGETWKNIWWQKVYTNSVSNTWTYSTTILHQSHRRHGRGYPLCILGPHGWRSAWHVSFSSPKLRPT